MTRPRFDNLPEDPLFPILEAVDGAGDLWFAGHCEAFRSGEREGLRRTFPELCRRILEPRREARVGAA